MSIRFTPTQALAALILCQLATSAFADPPGGGGGTCDPTDGACQPGDCYTGKYPNSDPPAPSTVACTEKSFPGDPDVTLRFPWQATPESARISCQVVADCELSCQAWPTGAHLTYVWTKTGPVQFNPTPMSYESYAMVNLNTPYSVQIQVKVYGPGSSGYTEAAWGVIPFSSCSAN